MQLRMTGETKDDISLCIPVPCNAQVRSLIWLGHIVGMRGIINRYLFKPNPQPAGNGWGFWQFPDNDKGWYIFLELDRLTILGSSCIMQGDDNEMD